MKNKIYIAGKITGMEKEAKAIFDEVENQLKAIGYETVNPMKLPHQHDKSWASYMRECLLALKECDEIYMIKNWNNSKGAKVELLTAIKNKLKIRFSGDFKNVQLNF